MKNTILKRLFLWSPSTDTGIVIFSEVLMLILSYLGLILFRKTWLSPIIFNFLGTIGVCVVLPLYWMVVVKKKGLDTLGITKKNWFVSLLVGMFLAGFSLWGYYRSFGISIAVIPALIVGVYALWEVVFVYGWLQLRFEEAFGIIPAAILAGLCFSLYHFGYGLYDFFDLAVLFIFGLIFAIVFRFTQNILILWPFLWPVSCLRGFEMGGVSSDWGDARFSAVLLVLMLISIFIFYRIEKTKEKGLKMQQWMKGVFLYYFAGVLLVLAYSSLWFLNTPTGVQLLRYVGVAIFAVGLVLIFLPMFVFRSKGKVKKENNWTKTSVLVDTGIYSVVRHPLYLGWLLMFVAIIFWSQHWLTIIVGGLGIICVYLISRQEEQTSIEKFGDDYKRYMKKVPRTNFILGIIRILRRRKGERK